MALRRADYTSRRYAFYLFLLLGLLWRRFLGRWLLYCFLDRRLLHCFLCRFLCLLGRLLGRLFGLLRFLRRLFGLLLRRLSWFLLRSLLLRGLLLPRRLLGFLSCFCNAESSGCTSAGLLYQLSILDTLLQSTPDKGGKLLSITFVVSSDVLFDRSQWWSLPFL